MGCTVTEDVDKKKQRKVTTGKVLFVVNDDLWTQKASGIVLEIFNEDIEGIPQSLPKLIIQQTNQKKKLIEDASGHFFQYNNCVMNLYYNYVKVHGIGGIRKKKII